MNKFIIALVASAASANAHPHGYQQQYQPAARRPWGQTQHRGHHYQYHYYNKPTYVTPTPYQYPSSHYATPPSINGSGGNGGGDNGGGDNGGGGATANEFVCSATCQVTDMDTYSATFVARPDGNGGSMTVLTQTCSSCLGDASYTATVNTYGGQSGTTTDCMAVGDALTTTTINGFTTDASGDGSDMDMSLTTPLLDLLGRSIVINSGLATICCTIGRAPDSDDCPQPEAATNGDATNGGATDGGATNGGGASDQTATHLAAWMAHHQALHTANLPHNHGYHAKPVYTAYTPVKQPAYHGHHAKPVYTAYTPVKQPAYHGGYYANQHRQVYSQPQAQSHYGSTHHGHHGHHGHQGHY